MKDVDVGQKIKFLSWFTAQHYPKEIEAIWFLHYIRRTPGLLKQVHFVTDAENYPRSILISSLEMDTPAFIYQKNGNISFSVSDTYTDLNDDESIPVHLEINFPNRHEVPLFLDVLEEDTQKDRLTESEKRQLKEFLDVHAERVEREFILKEIDKSLDHRDEKRFNELTELLKQYEV